MKAKPVRLEYGRGYVQCPVEQATHLTLNVPGPSGRLTLPVIQHGKREGTGCWTWNGSTDAPTLRPSVLTEGYSEKSNSPFRCHSWINDGAAQFLSDCSHELANTTVPLLDVPEEWDAAATTKQEEGETLPGILCPNGGYCDYPSNPCFTCRRPRPSNPSGDGSRQDQVSSMDADRGGERG